MDQCLNPLLLLLDCRRCVLQIFLASFQFFLQLLVLLAQVRHFKEHLLSFNFVLTDLHLVSLDFHLVFEQESLRGPLLKSTDLLLVLPGVDVGLEFQPVEKHTELEF